MIDYFYELIQQTGYTHPLHPAATHLPVGCVMAAFFFLLISRWARRPAFFQSARHCIGIAIIFLPVAVMLGYLDWQHNYAGAWMWPIKVKIALAGALFVCLLVAINLRRNLNRPGMLYFFIYAVCLALVSSIGYFGGELVYGARQKTSKIPKLTSLVQQGEALFMKKCAFCHHHDQTTAKVGPGLKGLIKHTNLPISGWPISDETLRKQIVSPFKDMPPFATFSKAELDQLVAFLKTL